MILDQKRKQFTLQDYFSFNNHARIIFLTSSSLLYIYVALLNFKNLSYILCKNFLNYIAKNMYAFLLNESDLKTWRKRKKKTSQKKNNTTTKQQCTAHSFKTDSSASSKNHYPHPFNDPGAIIVLETRMETSSSIPPPRFLLILQWLLQFSGRCAREVEARGDSSRLFSRPQWS